MHVTFSAFFPHVLLLVGSSFQFLTHVAFKSCTTLLIDDILGLSLFFRPLGSVLTILIHLLSLGLPLFLHSFFPISSFTLVLCAIKLTLLTHSNIILFFHLLQVNLFIVSIHRFRYVHHQLVL